MEKIVKKDPLTGETFVPKRSNQRFATSYNRKKFNNQSANLLRKKRDVIYASLNKTHRIIIYRVLAHHALKPKHRKTHATQTAG